jgi:two-component system, LuxR family, sensor kinase FixL
MADYEHLSREALLRQVRALEGARKSRGVAGLRDSEERLRAILQTAVEGIITIDERGVVETINPAAEKIFGWSAEEIVGQNVNRLMPPPYSREHDSYLEKYLHTGQAKIIGAGREVRGLRKDGTVFPMDLSVSEVRLSDRRLFAGFVRDITDRRRLEREILEISDRERQRIGQDLHDGLCQNLTGIELMSEVLEQKLTRKNRVEAARAGEIASHVREAIRHARLMARGLAPVTLESEGLMSGLKELAEKTGKLFGIHCRFVCEETILVPDLSVSTHLFRIAQEAVSNAVKHGEADEVFIRLEVGHENALLVVTDDGVGFPEPSAVSDGMGLHIMKYRAGVIGGSLSVLPRAAGGSEVVCAFPRDHLVQPADKRG